MLRDVLRDPDLLVRWSSIPDRMRIERELARQELDQLRRADDEIERGTLAANRLRETYPELAVTELLDQDGNEPPDRYIT